jgi:hypothetical protein
MTEIIPNDENTINFELEPVDTPVVTPPVTTSPVSPPGVQSPYVPSFTEYQISQLKSETPNIPKVAYTLGKRVLSLDVETTGLNPWDYKMVVCSVWDLNEPKSEMVTFSDWDEEQLMTCSIT